MSDTTLAHTLREGGKFVMYRVGRDCFFLRLMLPLLFLTTRRASSYGYRIYLDHLQLPTTHNSSDLHYFKISVLANFDAID